MKKYFVCTLMAAMLLPTGNVKADVETTLTSTESAYVWHITPAKDRDTMNFNGANLDTLWISNSSVFTDEKNYVGKAYIKGNNGRVAFYKFDLSEFADKGMTIKNAEVKITVYGYETTSKDVTTLENIYLYGYNPAWSAETLTYSNMVNEGITGGSGYTGTVSGASSFQYLDSINGQSTAPPYPVTLKYEAKTYLQSALDADSSYVSFAVVMKDVTRGLLSTNATLSINYTADKVNVNIGSSGYCTFSDTTQAYAVPLEAAAYIATIGQSEVNLTQVASITGEDIIPANTGVIIKGTPNSTITLTATETDKTVDGSGNVLHPSDKTLTSDGSTYYVLGTTTEGTAVFGPLKSGVAMKSNRAYFLSADIPVGAKASRLPIVFNDSHTTGITSAPATDVRGKAKIYNLQGAEVIAPDKGVYISNGKKIVK